MYMKKKINDNWAQEICDNLNRNVMLDHIEYVELGIRELDDDYYRALRVRAGIESMEQCLQLTPKIERAIAMAGLLHRGQYRKGYDHKVPYISHPLSVAEILAKYTNDEDTIIAGLLHDTIEDCDYSQAELSRDFGDKVAVIVRDVTEDIELKQSLGEKDSWAERKQKYLDHLAVSSQEAMLVSAADKIHNLTSMMAVYHQISAGLWSKFNAPPADILWYHTKIYTTIKQKLTSPIVEELGKILNEAREVMFYGITPLTESSG
jgi:(p)ppGpp synthase/HD superfamily hydrolase